MKTKEELIAVKDEVKTAKKKLPRQSKEYPEQATDDNALGEEISNPELFEQKEFVLVKKH